MASAALVVGGASPLGRTVVARLAAVARVALGEVDPAALGPALGEIARVRELYGRAEPPVLAVGRDAAALVRSADRLLPGGFGVVLVTPPPSLTVEAVASATAPGTPLVLVERQPFPEAAAPVRHALPEDRTLWTVTADAARWEGHRGPTATETGIARVVRDLLFPAA